MASGSEIIQILSPLPMTSDIGLSGQVVGLGLSSLQISVDAKALSQQTISKLQVSYGAAGQFDFYGTLKAAADGHVFEIEQPESLDSLTKLTARVRKDQHIEICAEQDVEASDKYTGFERLHFMPCALPELGLAQLDTRVSFLGRTFDYPMLISGMTGGVEKGALINQRLALAAEKFNIPMGIGSQRMAIEDNSLVDVFDVKQHAPNVFLIANLGFAQLRQADFLSQTEKAVEMVKADALAIHLNALQEMVQVEGDRDFSGVLERLTQVCKTLSVPVIVKEVGCGISQAVAEKLVDAGVSAIDVGGRGGTSWAYIEGRRASCEQTQALAETFRNWGIPTAYSLAAIRAKHKTFPLVATGGIRDGLTLAKAVAVGADMVGLGLPLLRAALSSQEQVYECLNTFVRGLQIAMVASGSGDLSALSEHIGLDEPHKVTFENLIFTG